MYAGVGGSLYPNWPQSSVAGYATTAAQSLIAYAKANNLDGYDLDFENGLNADWVSQWTQIIPLLGVSHKSSNVELSIQSLSELRVAHGYLKLSKYGIHQWYVIRGAADELS